MYKERNSALAAEERGNARGEGSLYRDVAGNKKRVEDGIEKPSPSTSKGGIGKEKDRLAPAAAATQPRRHAGQEARPAPEKAKYPDDGELSDTSEGWKHCPV
jgi:casein kinase II subunit beta